MSTTGMLPVDGLGPVGWHISTYSANCGGNCVEAGPLMDGTGRVAVRHSKQPDGSAIIYTPDEWSAFIAGVKAGQFEFGGA
jgi:hypothetical protein